MTCDICNDLPVNILPSSLCVRHSNMHGECTLIEAKGNYYQHNDQLQKALRCYAHALGILPKFIPALLQRTLLFQRNNRYAQALQSADEWLKISSADGDALAFKGTALWWLGKYSEAIEYFQKSKYFDRGIDCLKQVPLCYAYALYAVGQYVEALKTLQWCNQKAIRSTTTLKN